MKYTIRCPFLRARRTCAEKRAEQTLWLMHFFPSLHLFSIYTYAHALFSAQTLNFAFEPFFSVSFSFRFSSIQWSLKIESLYTNAELHAFKRTKEKKVSNNRDIKRNSMKKYKDNNKIGWKRNKSLCVCAVCSSHVFTVSITPKQKSLDWTT